MEIDTVRCEQWVVYEQTTPTARWLRRAEIEYLGGGNHGAPYTAGAWICSVCVVMFHWMRWNNRRDR